MARFGAWKWQLPFGRSRRKKDKASPGATCSPPIRIESYMVKRWQHATGRAPKALASFRGHVLTRAVVVWRPYGIALPTKSFQAFSVRETEVHGAARSESAFL